jgi:hypothetical protein
MMKIGATRGTVTLTKDLVPEKSFARTIARWNSY